MNTLIIVNTLTHPSGSFLQVVSDNHQLVLCNNKRRTVQLVCCNTNKGNTEPCKEGDEPKQEFLARMGHLQTQKLWFTKFLDERSTYSTKFVEEADTELDAIVEETSKDIDEASAKNSSFNSSQDVFRLESDVQPRNLICSSPKPRSWFGPNGQYVRESPCPSCRGRGYTACTECGIDRSRLNCLLCNGKGLRTCGQCFGDRVIWEESIDERPWEKARSSSPFNVKEDDDVDKLVVKLKERKKRVYKSVPPEVCRKISSSLRGLNAKTGMFTKRMKDIHSNPILRAQRIDAIKEAKGTDAARKRASEALKDFFSNPENRLKRSIAMKGVKFYCRNCGKEGHRKHYCPELVAGCNDRRYRCQICGERGHNRRTCTQVQKSIEPKKKHQPKVRRRGCIRTDHHNNCKTYSIVARKDGESDRLLKNSKSVRSYSCRICSRKGHNSRTCTKNILS